MTFRVELANWLEANCDTDTIIDLWNAYCDATEWSAAKVWRMSEFDKFISEDGMHDICDLRRIYNGGRFCTSDPFFNATPYTIESFDDHEMDIFIDSLSLADYIIENDDDLGNDKLRDFLDTYETIERRAQEEHDYDERFDR